MVERGLEGVVALASAISTIVEEKSLLTYRGISIDELAAHASFEEVVYLLWYGSLPTRSELDKLRADLGANRELPPQLLRQLRDWPGESHPMDVVRTGVSALALWDPDARSMDRDANLRKAVRITAKLPTIVAAFDRLRHGQEPVKPDPALGTAECFLHLLWNKRPDAETVREFDRALVLHADHELNASTFAARVTAATLSDIHSSIVSAIGALKGPLHGGANEAVMTMLQKIGDVANVEPFVQNLFDQKKLVMGFGHRVYKHGDPRAKWLKEMSRQQAEKHHEMKWYEMSTRVDELVQREKGLLPNVDFYSASAYYSLGMPIDLYTPIFAIARVSGWIAHVLEQYIDNRLIRPRALYTGPEDVRYVPIDQRS